MVALTVLTPQTAEAAFDAAVGPYVDLGYRLAASMLRDRAEAEDAVQEATLKAWRSFGRLRPESNVRAWFLTIVANQCKSMRRGRWFGLIRQADPAQHLAAEEAGYGRTELALSLASLPPVDRAAVHLRYYEDLSLEEVSQALGISMTAARSRISRALRRLRLTLEDVQ